MITRQLVICRYNETNSWFKDVTIPILIYDKSDNKLKDSIALENISRESYVYLKHIIDSYDNLADITWFSQYDLMPHITYPNPPDPNHCFSSLCNKINNSIITEFTPITYLSEALYYGKPNELPVDKFYKDLFSKEHIKIDGVSKYKFAIGACFGVPKQALLNHPKSFYIKCMDMLLSGEYKLPNAREWYYRDNCAEWIMERLYATIFSSI